MSNTTSTTKNQPASSTANAESLEEREKLLAEELRNHCVKDKRSRKMKERYPKQSSKIIHELGRVYRERSPDKIAIIKSATLFNAAIVREPDNLDEVRVDLSELCAHVLHLADAENKTADFVQQADYILKQVGEMRSMVKTELDKLGLLSTGLDFMEKSQKADQIEELQEKLTQAYIKIMRQIMEYCIKVKGPVPCQYALIGMGSLARKEITPYSDFESAVLLENGIETKENYEETLEYFRWVAVFFQLVMVNFGETIIRFVAISSLNNPCNKDEDWFYDAFTPCGICPDGLAPQASKNPLGRQDSTENKSWITELIKPVSEMLKYLDAEEDVKNGYHLADILTKTCYISGSKDLHNVFTKLVKRKLADEKLTSSFIRQVKEDQRKFNGYVCSLKIALADSFDLKQTIYRSITLSLAALARLYGLEWSSSFDIIEQLEEKELTSDYDCKYALSTALEARLRVYTKNEGQTDEIDYAEHGIYVRPMHQVVEHLSGDGLAEFIDPTLSLQDLVISTLKEKEENQIETRAAKLNKNPTSSKKEIEERETVESRRPQTRAPDAINDVSSRTSAKTRSQQEAFDAFVEFVRNIGKTLGIIDEFLINYFSEDSTRLFMDLFVKASCDAIANIFLEDESLVQNKIRTLILKMLTKPSDQWTNSEYDSMFEIFLSYMGDYDRKSLQSFTARMKIQSQPLDVGPTRSLLESLVTENYYSHYQSYLELFDFLRRNTTWLSFKDDEMIEDDLD